jgi:hypothetical protein
MKTFEVMNEDYSKDKFYGYYEWKKEELE